MVKKGPDWTSTLRSARKNELYHSTGICTWDPKNEATKDHGPGRLASLDVTQSKTITSMDRNILPRIEKHGRAGGQALVRPP